MIHRKITKDIKYITGYHTQEFRHSGALDKPIQGKPEEAWLGIGYYFWLEEDFAVYWGIDKKKKRTGYYDIYSAEIEEGEILNASFNEKAYFKFRQMIDDAVAHFLNKSKKVTLLQVHRFLSDTFWSKHGVTGIIFDDLPHNNDAKNRVYSYIEPFYYKKRLQLVVFDRQIIHNFAIHKEEQC